MKIRGWKGWKVRRWKGWKVRGWKWWKVKGLKGWKVGGKRKEGKLIPSTIPSLYLPHKNFSLVTFGHQSSTKYTALHKQWTWSRVRNVKTSKTPILLVKFKLSIKHVTIDNRLLRHDVNTIVFIHHPYLVLSA